MMTLARVSFARLLRTSRSWIPILAWMVVSLVVAIVAHGSGGAMGSNHVMHGAFRWIVVPLVAYGVVSGALGGMGLKKAIRGVVSMGASPRRAALATTLVAMAASALVCGVLAFVVCLVAHGVADSPLAGDLFASTWVSALGGLVYAAFFCAGSAIGSGAARGVFLAFDWLVGSSTSALGVITPRGHLFSLMGGPACADISARASSILMLGLAVWFVVLAVLFVRRV